MQVKKLPPVLLQDRKTMEHYFKHCLKTFPKTFQMPLLLTQQYYASLPGPGLFFEPAQCVYLQPAQSVLLTKHTENLRM